MSWIKDTDRKTKNMMKRHEEEKRKELERLLPQASPTLPKTSNSISSSENIESSKGKFTASPNASFGKTPFTTDLEPEHTILKSSMGQYYGGHKAHPAGGLINKEDSGIIELTNKHLTFTKATLTGKGGWTIKIPLVSIQLDKWGIKEEARRTSALGTGGGFPTLFGAGGLGGGTMWQQGKRHELIVPYIDENGIPQEPRFSVSSITGKAIKEWAEKLYEAVVRAKQQKELEEKTKADTQSSITKNQTSKETYDPLLVLKLRLAKGEITKEEFEELRKMIES
jgi:hypothetical protein